MCFILFHQIYHIQVASFGFYLVILLVISRWASRRLKSGPNKDDHLQKCGAFTLFHFLPPPKKQLQVGDPISSQFFSQQIVFPGRFNQTPSGSGQQVAIKDQELDCQGAQQKAGCGSFGPRLRAARSSSGVTWGPPINMAEKSFGVTGVYL